MSDEHKKKIEDQQKAEREKIDKEKKEKEKAMEKERKETKKQYEESQDKKEKKARMDEKRRPYKTSMGLRLLNSVVGFVLLISPVYIFLNEDIVLDTAVLIFGVIVALSGIARIINAFYEKEISGTKRIIRLLIGLLLLVIAILAFINPDIGEDTLLIVIATAIAFQGIGRVLLGFGHDTYPAWLKLTMIILGLVSIGIAVSAFTDYAIGSFEIEQNDLINLFAAAFFIGGISRIGQSIAGLNQSKK